MAPTAEPGRSSGWPQLSAGAVALVAFGLAVVGIRVAEPAEPILDVFYRGLQMFVLDTGALEGRTPANPLLEIARFLAPLATVLAVLVALRRVLDAELRRRRIARSRGHTMVCGDGAAARALAQNLHAAGSAVVLVGGATLGDEIPTVPGDPREPATLRAAGIGGAQVLYAFGNQSAANAAVVLAAGTVRAETGATLSTFAQVHSDELVDALRVRRMAADRPSNVTIDFFSLNDIAARMLVSRYPARGCTPVVVGFGPLGRAVLRAIVRAPAGAPRPHPVVVVAGVEDVQQEATRLEAVRRGWEIRTGQDGDGDGPVYVCLVDLVDEDEAIATGLRLARSGDRDIVVCLERESPFRQALHVAVRLKVFGVLDASCQEDAIAADSIVGRAARAIHERYRAEASRRGESIEVNPSMKPWVDLAPHLKESNLAQAEHVSVKLAALGATLTTSPPPIPFAFADDAEVLRLAKMEHMRWVEEREAAGYRYGPRREGMRHPDLVDWLNLSENSKQKDIDAIRNLPDLLAQEGLYIRRDT